MRTINEVPIASVPVSTQTWSIYRLMTNCPLKSEYSGLDQRYIDRVFFQSKLFVLICLPQMTESLLFCVW